MPSKDDDNLDPVPSIRVTRGERNSSAAQRGPSNRPAAAPGVKAGGEPRAKQGWLGNVALAGVVVLAGGFIWQNIQLSSALAAAQQQRTQAEERIVALEAMFTSSSDDVSQNAQVVAAKLKWADSEIRKLWGVAHDRNRKAIATNKDSIANVDARLKKLNSQAVAASKAATANTAAVKQLDGRVKTSATDVREALQRLSLAQETLGELDSTIAQLSRRIGQLESAQRSGAAADKQTVTALKDSVDSLEKWRLSTNREINRLQAIVGG